METHDIRITASNKTGADEARAIICSILEDKGSTVRAPEGDGEKRKKILETGTIIEMLIGIPIGISIGLVANEIHRRILSSANKSSEVTLEESDGTIVITHTKTGLRIAITDPKDGESAE